MRNVDRAAAFACVVATAPCAVAQQPDSAAVRRAVPSDQALTLEQALREAHAANAHLPVASLNTAMARAQLRAARAALLPALLIDGDVHAGMPQTYALSDARAQLVGVDTLYDGGRLRATIAASGYDVRRATAGYRAVEKDVDLNVRLQFSDGLRAQQELAIREAGLSRLRSYLALIQARQAAGEGVTGDLLRTETRLGTELADSADAERRLDEAQVELNNLMGRSPRAPLVLAPLPPPAPPVVPTGTPWLQVPDVRAAEAEQAATRARIEIARANRLPSIALTANVGVQPMLGDTNTGAGLNTGTGAGTEVTLTVSWPLFDFGLYRARLTQAQLAATLAEDSLIVVRRQAALEWARAVEQMDDLYAQVELRSRNVPLARDAYLETESLYRGGAATSLEVLDAFAAWVNAQIAEADAVLAYRQADARLQRWGTP